MNMKMLMLLQFGLLLVLLPDYIVEGKRDPVLYCGACRALVDELLYEIKKVNPKKTTEVGSFRIFPDGTQEKNKIPLAKSESYLTEVLENICDRMNDYSLHVDPETQEKSYKRFAPRDGEQMGTINFNSFQFNPDTSNYLKFACESVVEDHEDEILSLIAQEADSLADKLCVKKSERERRTNFQTSADLKYMTWASFYKAMVAIPIAANVMKWTGLHCYCDFLKGSYIINIWKQRRV